MLKKHNQFIQKKNLKWLYTACLSLIVLGPLSVAMAVTKNCTFTNKFSNYGTSSVMICCYDSSWNGRLWAQGATCPFPATSTHFCTKKTEIYGFSSGTKWEDACRNDV